MRATDIVKKSSNHFEEIEDKRFSSIMSSSSSYIEQSSSPSQLALDIHPYTSSIDKISSDHGLSHDSGVSFGMSSRKRNALQQQKKSMSQSSSSSSLKKVQAITDEARNEDRVIESPTARSAFDASEDVWRDVARRIKPFGDILRQGASN